MEQSDFLNGNALDDLREAIRQAENLDFHHAAAGTLEGDHYARLVSLERRLNDNAAKTIRPPTSREAHLGTYVLVEHPERPGDGSSGSTPELPDGGRETH